MSRDPYAVLGLSRDASEAEVKNAWKKLVKKHHPDRNRDDPNAEQKMAEINAAYDEITKPKPQGQQQQYSHPEWDHDPFASFHGVPPEFQDLFRQFHGFNKPRNRDIHATHTIRLEDAFRGADISATMPDGRTVHARIPPGVDNGARIKVAGAGERVHANLPPGDLYITVRVLPHPVFHRQGEHLYVERDFDAVDCALGTSLEIDLIDGSRVRVTIPPGTQHGNAMRVGEHGMPILHNGARRGSLFVVVKVAVPTNLSEAQKAALESYRAAK